jgi:hypothetical protein
VNQREGARIRPRILIVRGRRKSRVLHRVRIAAQVRARNFWLKRYAKPDQRIAQRDYHWVDFLISIALQLVVHHLLHFHRDVGRSKERRLFAVFTGVLEGSFHCRDRRDRFFILSVAFYNVVAEPQLACLEEVHYICSADRAIPEKDRVLCCLANIELAGVERTGFEHASAYGHGWLLKPGRATAASAGRRLPTLARKPGNLGGWDASKMRIFRTSRAGMHLFRTSLAAIVARAGGV